MVATGKQFVRLGLMVAPRQRSNDRSSESAFSPAGLALTTPVSPIETQLRKVVPELCVYDVTERVAEVEMSSSTPVRSDPLPDRLQPFAEILVDEEEQRINRVEGNENTQDDGEEREGVVAQGERSRPLPQPKLPSQQEDQEHELTHIPYHSWCVHCVRGAGRSDAHRRRARQSEEERGQRMVICAQKEMELIGWRKTKRYSVGEQASGHWRNPCTSCLGKRKRRPVDSRKDQGRHRRTWIRRCACSDQVVVDVQRAVIAKRSNACEQSRWRFSIQRTSRKRNQERSKCGGLLT